MTELDRKNLERTHVRRSTWIVLVVTLLLACALDSSSADDGATATVDRVWIQGDSLYVDFEITGLFTDHIRNGLARGLPMTYSYVLELWRERSGWWDALESRGICEFKIQRSVWDDLYMLDDRLGKNLSFQEIESLERHLCAREGEAVASIRELRADKSYYVVLIPTLRPLTIEDIREVEAWLTGEFEEGRKKTGLSTVGRLPRMIFGVFVDLAGLGDKSILARSGAFRVAHLPQDATIDGYSDTNTKHSLD